MPRNVRREVAPEDDLTIPAFLRRERTPESREMVEKVLRSHERREWKMPDRSNEMAAKKEADTQKTRKTLEVENPDLPVDMNLVTSEGKTESRKFSNAQEFIDWFDPKLHELEGSIADASSTMVSVREKPRKLAKAKGDPKMRGVNAVEGPIPQPEKNARAAARPGRSAPQKKKKKGGGFTKHGVRVGGKEYRSTWEAFQKLGLGSASECVKFRNALKSSSTGSMVYEKNGKKHKFEMFEVKQ